MLGRPFFKSFYTFFNYEALRLDIGSSLGLPGMIKDLNEAPPHVIDKTLLFILLGIALILILTGLILCVFSIMNKRKELAQQDFSENFRNKHMVEHYEYMNNIRDVIKSNQPYS